jgi:salicylate hydroxylase
MRCGRGFSLLLAHRNSDHAVCLAQVLDQADGDFVSAFRRYEAARSLRTARLQFESRYHWDNFYHVAGIEREVAREIWSKRSEKEMFECLAWLYDGFAPPQSAPLEGRATTSFL